MLPERTQIAYSSMYNYVAGCWGIPDKAEGQFSGETNKNFYFNSTIDNLADFKTWLGTHNITVYYAMSFPSVSLISDQDLLEDLNSLTNAPSDTINDFIDWYWTDIT